MDYDLICVGFGLYGLAITTSLADKCPKLKVLAIERKQSYSPNFGHGRSDQASGSTFFKDLITLQNPRSGFTFINFLHEKHLLLGFLNVSQLRPSRRLLQSYLVWVAEKIAAAGWVAYGQHVESTSPVYAEDGRITHWSVELRNVTDGTRSVLKTKRLVFTMRSIPQKPAELRHIPDHFIRTFAEQEAIMRALSASSKTQRIAVIGSDQQAVELFQELMAMPGQHHATMMFEGSALRVEDTTPFTRELADGGGAGALLQRLPPEIRRTVLATEVASKFATIELSTLEDLYAALYQQSIQESDPSQHRFQLAPYSTISRVAMQTAAVDLEVLNSTTGRLSRHSGPYDMIITNLVSDPRAPCSPMPSLLRTAKEKGLSVDSEYAISFGKLKLEEDVGAWALGSLVDPRTRVDDLSMLSESAHRAKQSILAKMAATVSRAETKVMPAML